MTLAERKEGRREKLLSRIADEKRMLEDGAYNGGNGRSFHAQIAYLQRRLKSTAGKLGNSHKRIETLTETVERQEQEIKHLRQIIAALRRVA